ncbi:MAG: flagellar basal-body rod protein FlgF [Deltaproteobacteria bacterium]|nr:MAG: flagellar basal-body rod protein FlgF [Deltaproteobacteria bacterium]
MANDISTMAASMDQKILQLQHITHNLANASTPGFKAEHLLILNAPQQENKPGNSGASLKALVVDFARGISQRTDNPLDLDLQGDGFFVVQTQDGQAYTRKGDFTVNSLKQLVTQAGDPVIGEGGPITLRSGKIHVAGNGSIFVDESQVGQLKIVDFGNRQNLRNAGDGLYIDDGTAGVKKADRPAIASGSIELSNVNIVNEMAGMIEVHRSFEAYQKIIQMLTDQDKLAVSRVGRV